MTPFASLLQPFSESPPPRSSEMTRILPSEVVSDWCEIEMLRTSEVGAPFGMKASACGGPASGSKWMIHVELIAATYSVCESALKKTSWGRQVPPELDPSGFFITM